jgi:hypothetical protein
MNTLQRKSKNSSLVQLTMSELGRGLTASQTVARYSRILSERAIVSIEDQGNKYNNGLLFALTMEQPRSKHARPVISDLANSFHNSSSMKKHIKKYFLTMCETHVANEKESTLSQGELNALVGQYCSNAHKWNHKGHTHCGIWPTISMINHSCDPTVIIVQDEKKDFTMHVYSNKDLCKDQSLTVSYLSEADLEKSVQERKDIILSSFSFECCCPRCIEEENEHTH